METEDEMAFLRALGWFLLLAGGFLCLMGLMTLPDGGLMFALPYVFLIPGLCMVFFGYLLLRIRRRDWPGPGESGDSPGRE